jgi:HEAT repeat protein
VTSIPPSTSAAPATPGGPREPPLVEPPFSPVVVEELLRLIVKAVRAHQLYLPNNPIYRGAIDALKAGYAAVWAEADELVLTVTETDLRWHEVSVHGDGTKSSESLAWLFFKDGVRELRMAKGFDDAEVLKLLEIVQRARKGSPDEDDLITMLWEADFGLLTYKYVDLLSEGTGGDELADGSEATPADASQVKGAVQEAVEESRAGGVVNMADFDTTLYFLDEREIEYIQNEIAREYRQDLRALVVASLLDIFEQQADPDIRDEVLENVNTLMVYLLTTGHFRGVAHLLRESRVATDRAGELSADQRQRLSQLADRLSATDALSQLLQALDEAPALPPQEELIELFEQLRPTALGTVFQWLARVHNERLRPLLETAAGRLATANTAELVRLIQAPEREVSSEAIRRAGALKAQAAVLALGKVMGEADPNRRQIAVAALTEIASPGALQVLEKAIEDGDREVRITAVRALTSRNYRPVLPRLEAVIKGKMVREADLTEKMAFFEAYGAICGDPGVVHLDAILNGKGFLGRREEPELRACAAIALGRIGTPRALDALRKTASEKDVVVRNAVSRALRGGSASS